MAEDIRDCLPPDRNPRKPKLVLPKGAVDTHVHVSEPSYTLAPGRGYNPPDSTLADLKHLYATLGVNRVVLTQPSIFRDSARAPLVAITMGVSDDELAALDGRRA